MSQYKNDAIESSPILTVSIPNWEKYQPRNDRQTFTWFKLHCEFFSDAVVYELPNLAKLVLIYLYCQQNKSGNKPFKLNVNAAAVQTSIKPNDLRKCLIQLNSAGLASIDIHPTPGREVITGVGCLEERRGEEKRGDGKDPGDGVTQESLPQSPASSSGEAGGEPPRENPFGVDLEKFVPIWCETFRCDESWILRELGKARTWLAANPAKRKKDLPRFYLNWLNRADGDRPARLNPASQGQRTVKIYNPDSGQYEDKVCNDDGF